MRAFGWNPPNDNARIRALNRASREAGDSVLAGIVAAETSDNSALCCSLDQSWLGSCQANAAAQTLYMAMVKAGLPAFVFSRLWGYLQARASEGTIAQDCGANIGDVFAALAGKGIPPESAWPYVPELFAVNPGPTADMPAYDSRGVIGINYHPISSSGDALIEDIERACTAGFGVAFGCQVGPTYDDGPPIVTVQPPKEGEETGGHAQTVVGHDRPGRRFLIKGSWGDDYRDPTAPAGCTWFAYDYVNDSIGQWRDLWIVTALPGGLQP
jgi:hypothetical protein